MHKMFKKKLIDDDISMRRFIMSCIHAYIAGEITVDENPILPRGQDPDLRLHGIIDEYRVLLKDMNGNILNPLPMTEDLI